MMMMFVIDRQCMQPQRTQGAEHFSVSPVSPVVNPCAIIE